MTNAWLAISLAAVLLLNPGICAASVFTGQAAHTCCPSTHGAPIAKGCANLGCVKPGPVLPPRDFGGYVTLPVPPSEGFAPAQELAAGTFIAATDPACVPAHRFLNFHQLLI